MFRVDSDGAVSVQPAPASAGAISGFYDKGNPSLGIRATQVPFDHMNAMQEELVNAILSKDISLAKSVDDQLARAIQRKKVHTVTDADYTILDDDFFDVILVSTGASQRTITLPTASANENRVIQFKKIDSGAGNFVIDGEGAETIDGEATKAVHSQFDSITLVCNGSNWNILDNTSKTDFQLIQTSNTTVADSTDTDLTGASGFIPSGDYAFTLCTQAQVTFGSTVATRGGVRARIVDSSNNVVFDLERNAPVSLGDADLVMNGNFSVANVITWAGGDLKLQGRIFVSGGSGSITRQVRSGAALLRRIGD